MYQTFIQLIARFQNQKIMVIGDMVADVYLEGGISRISREAPVLILEHLAERVVPGGAANVVYNAATLGAHVYAVGVLGNDHAGIKLRRILQDQAVVTDGLIADDGRPTITKTRVMAGGQATVRQQVVRIDRESKAVLAAAVESRILNYLEQTIGDMAVVVMSDYGSKTLTASMIVKIISLCRKLGIPTIVDSRYHVMNYQGVSLVKQNESEAAAVMGLTQLDDAQVLEAGRSIQQRLEADAVLITCGPDGMLLVERSAPPVSIAVTNKSEVYDVTGAGDTVVAASALALAAGGGYHDAACIANFAAGIVVRKPGTATTSAVELCEVIKEHYEDRK